jgi:hypothetical protein
VRIVERVGIRSVVIMGSSREYWEHARECARWAQEAENNEDQNVLQEMAKAWAHIALVESNVARHAAIDQMLLGMPQPTGH